MQSVTAGVERLVPTYYAEVTPTVIISDPLFSSVYKTNAVDLTDAIVAYEHEVAVDGGFRTAEIELILTTNEIEDWIEDGLCRHVVVYNAAREVIWEGAVNEVVASMGSLSFTRGPWLEIANRVSVAYTPYIDITVDPPVTGSKTVTTIAEDLDSQARYGILEDVVSGGTLIDDATVTGTTAENQAEEIRDAYLAEYRLPASSQTITVGQANAPRLTLRCVGYNELLKKYVYNNTGTGYTTAPAKIAAVLAADPNGVLSTDTTYIADDAGHLLIAAVHDDEDRLAKTVLDELVAQGDSTNNRTFLMILADRKTHYDSIPTSVAYYHALADRKAEITDLAGAEVLPWNVRAGRWLLVTDFMAGRARSGTEMRADPRAVFLETARYQLPWGVTLTGSRITKVKQLVAKYGGSS